MRIFSGPGGAPPGGGTVWGHEHHRQVDPNYYSPFQGGLCDRFLSNLCGPISTCAYVLCCCCLLQDCCFRGHRDYYDYDDLGPPPPPPPPIPSAASSGLWGSPPSGPGPTGYPAQPGPPGGPIARPFY